MKIYNSPIGTIKDLGNSNNKINKQLKALNKLEEAIHLQADLLDLKANPKRDARIT